MPESNIPTSNLPEFDGTIEINRSVPSPPEDAQMVDVVRRILGDAGFADGSISIAIVDDSTIHALNRQYLQHDYPTDVLSFCLAGDDPPGPLDGEVIVSQQTAARAAPEYRWSAAEELLLYIIHGTLHLTGHDDATVAQQQTMQRAENHYLNQAGITRPAALPESTGPIDGIQP